MAENGRPKRSLIGEALDILDDQVELASLELEYEATLGARRIAALAGIAILVVTGFALLQVAMIWGLMKLGLSVGISSLILAFLYGGGAALIYRVLVRRDPKVGGAFAGTREELHKNIRWIRHFFS